MPVSIRGELGPGRDVDAIVELQSHSGIYWRFCDSAYPVESAPPKAPRDGRYHRQGDDGRWYGSSCPIASWAELMRASPNVSVSQWKGDAWSFGYIQVQDLSILDLTDFSTLDQLNLTWEELRSNLWDLTQRLAGMVWAEDEVEGILAPGAPLDGHLILVLRPNVMTGSHFVGKQEMAGQSPPRYLEFLSGSIRRVIAKP
ncbi:hypothetical protein AB0I68_05055 [Streptomyces sp. NPDC050448]|uniref:hypothetical protein n=1 Tax=Streptomyces sp. NPDC050448 TaxID=3155404 RepID=UPI003423BA7F